MLSCPPGLHTALGSALWLHVLKPRFGSYSRHVRSSGQRTGEDGQRPGALLGAAEPPGRPVGTFPGPREVLAVRSRLESG